jgi:hypothetical protein
MNLHQELDVLYDAFCRTLPEELQPVGCDLPHALGLAPRPGIRWSEVFHHEVTLAAPALFTEAMPDIHPAIVRNALLAHMLAIIEAFGSDRIADGQIEPTPALRAVLGHARESRDRAIRQVDPPGVDSSSEFEQADEKVAWATSEERAVMQLGEAVDFGHYEGVSLAKQSVGFPASLALARAAGWDSKQCAGVLRTLSSVCLALQFQDDGRVRVNEMVLQSGVMARMLARAHRHYRGARLRARALGARRLAAWAEGREKNCELLARSEEKNAGFAVRAHLLAPWAAEVFA